jgi:hypothetical protein
MAVTIPASFPLRNIGIAGQKILDGDGTTTHPGLIAQGRASNYLIAKAGLRHHILEDWQSPWESTVSLTRIPTAIAGHGPHWWIDVTPGWEEVYCAFLVMVTDPFESYEVTVYSTVDSVTTAVNNAAWAWVDASAALGVTDVGFDEIYLEIESVGGSETIYLAGVSVWEEPRTSF